MRKLLFVASRTGLLLLSYLSLQAVVAGPAEPAGPAEDGTMPALAAIAATSRRMTNPSGAVQRLKNPRTKRRK